MIKFAKTSSALQPVPSTRRRVGSPKTSSCGPVDQDAAILEALHRLDRAQAWQNYLFDEPTSDVQDEAIRSAVRAERMALVELVHRVAEAAGVDLPGHPAIQNSQVIEIHQVPLAVYLAGDKLLQVIMGENDLGIQIQTASGQDVWVRLVVTDFGSFGSQTRSRRRALARVS